MPVESCGPIVQFYAQGRSKFWDRGVINRNYLGWSRIATVIAALALGLALQACSQTAGSGPDFSALTSARSTNAPAPEERSTVEIGGGLKVDVYARAPSRLASLLGTKPEASAPVLLYVHGGGWVKGTREKVYNLPAYAKSRGYLLVSVDYRPLPKNTIEGQVRDVVSGINWVRNNIATYGGDPSRIVIMGHSSGSHLVALIGARKLGGSLRGIVANDVQAYDLPTYYRLRKNSMDPVYRKAFGANRATWVKYSPITYVPQNSGFPPFLIMHSGSNGERRRALAEAFAAKLRQKGTQVTLFDGKAYSHGTIASSIGRSAAVTQALDRFLKAVYR